MKKGLKRRVLAVLLAVLLLGTFSVINLETILTFADELISANGSGGSGGQSLEEGGDTTRNLPLETEPPPLVTGIAPPIFNLPAGSEFWETTFTPFDIYGAIKDSSDLQYLIDAGEIYFEITGDTYLYATVYIPSGRNVTINGAGNIYASSLDVAFTVESGATLTLEEGILINGGESTLTGILVSYGGTLHTYGAIIEGFQEQAVRVYDDATFVMNGGALRGNGTGALVCGQITLNGGAIHNNSDSGLIIGQALCGFGEFIMNDGRIHYNTSSVGSGVRIVNGNFVMYAGEIDSNIARPDTASQFPESADAAGVRVGLYGTGGAYGRFEMHGGRIFNNVSLSTLYNAQGGGVSVVEVGHFLMTAGSIDNNEAQNGGGVGHSGLEALLQTTIGPDAFVIDNYARNGGGAGNLLYATHGQRIQPVTSAAYAPNAFNNHDITAMGFLVELFNVETGYRGEGWYEMGENASVYPGTRVGYEFSHWTVAGHAVIPFSTPNRDITSGGIVQDTGFVNFPIDPVIEPVFTMGVIPASGSVQFHAHWEASAYNRIIFEITDYGVARPHHYVLTGAPNNLEQYTMEIEVGSLITAQSEYITKAEGINALSASLAREGYRLAGWFTEDMGEGWLELGDIDENAIMPSGEPILFITHWEPLTFNVNYRWVDTDGNDITDADKSEVSTVDNYTPHTFDRDEDFDEDDPRGWYVELYIPALYGWKFEGFEISIPDMGGYRVYFDMPEDHPAEFASYRIPGHINGRGTWGVVNVTAVFSIPLPPVGIMPGVPGGVAPPIGIVPPGEIPPVGITPPIGAVPPDEIPPVGVVPPIGTVPPDEIPPVGITPPIGTVPPGEVQPPTGITPEIPGGIVPPIGTVPPTGITPEVPGTVIPPIGTVPPTGEVPGTAIPPIGTVPPGEVEPPEETQPPVGITPQVPGDVTPPGPAPAPEMPEIIVPPIIIAPPLGAAPGASTEGEPDTTDLDEDSETPESSLDVDVPNVVEGGPDDPAGAGGNPNLNQNPGTGDEFNILTMVTLFGAFIISSLCLVLIIKKRRRYEKI